MVQKVQMSLYILNESSKMNSEYKGGMSYENVDRYGTAAQIR